MRDNETVGIATIIVGLVLVIGAVRGTWKKIFEDVVVGAGSSSGSGSSSSSSSGCTGFNVLGQCIGIPSGPVTGIPFSPFVYQPGTATELGSGGPAYPVTNPNGVAPATVVYGQ